jgi:hypothetical protein
MHPSMRIVQNTVGGQAEHRDPTKGETQTVTSSPADRAI